MHQNLDPINDIKKNIVTLVSRGLEFNTSIRKKYEAVASINVLYNWINSIVDQ